MENYILTSGIGHGNFKLTSFDDALISSGVFNYNLVKVSSILPAHATLKDRIELKEGSVLFTAYSSISSNIKGEQLATAIAVGIPEDSEKPGIIMEHSLNSTKEQVIKDITAMVKEAMGKRGYIIKEIKVVAVEALSEGKEFVTAYAGLSMW